MKTVFKGRLIHCLVKPVTLPNGHRVNLEFIKHPGAVLIVPFLSRDRLIILRQFRSAVNRYLYEFPAGTLEIGESPVSCAKRELIEETGYAASRLKQLGGIFPVPGYSTEKIVIYQANGLKRRERLIQKDEVIRVEIKTPAQLQRLFHENKLQDAKTICALAFCGIL